MIQKSEKVKKWRKETKKRIVESMGGGCVCCGYTRCLRALDLHHLDPEEKEFGFGRIMANPIRWEKIVEELRKCVLVCKRCHAEIHDGILKIPENATRFDESFTTYKNQKKEACPVCGNDKPLHLITCSKSCAAKRAGKVNWDAIDLKGLLKEKTSIVKIAERIGVSDTSVYKRMRKLGLERC